MKNENDLIPCDDELNRLKEFLVGIKSGHDNVFFGPRPDLNLTPAPGENTTLREEIRACWSALRDLERKRIVY